MIAVITDLHEVRKISRHPLEFQNTGFPVCSTRRNGRRVQLSRSLLCQAEAERENYLEQLDGCDIRRFVCPPRIIGFPNNLPIKKERPLYNEEEVEADSDDPEDCRVFVYLSRFYFV